MGTIRNPSIVHSVRGYQSAHDLNFNRFVHNLAAGYSITPAAGGDASLSVADKIQIGVVPAGEKLVPQLCLLKIPALDTDGSPTGDYQVGTATDPDALKGSAASETAVNLFGEDWILTGTADIGSKDEDVPIYITIINASATRAPTGLIVFEQVTRAFDDANDTNVT